MDWKYIPRKDKIALSILLIGVFFFACLNFRLSQHKTKGNKLETVQSDTIAWYYHRDVFDKTESNLRTETGIWDINSISYEHLLPFCENDSTTASQLINYRNRLRGFHSLSQLMNIRTINTTDYLRLANALAILSNPDSIYINTETFESLLQHPYLNYAQCMAITDIRKRKAPLRSFARLSLLDEFTTKDIERLQAYISFSDKIPK